jgi:hypothetical protein
MYTHTHTYTHISKYTLDPFPPFTSTPNPFPSVISTCGPSSIFISLALTLAISLTLALTLALTLSPTPPPLLSIPRIALFSFSILSFSAFVSNLNWILSSSVSFSVFHNYIIIWKIVIFIDVMMLHLRTYAILF